MQHKLTAASTIIAAYLTTSLFAQTKPAPVTENSTAILVCTPPSTLFGFCVTIAGNIVQLYSPAGIYHTSSEGYALCSSYDPLNQAPVPVAYDAVSPEANWGPPSGLPSFPVIITRFSSDGFRLVQTITYDMAEQDITIVMTLTNLSAATRYNVRLDRYVDVDANGTTSNVFGRTLDGVYGYVDSGRGLMLSDITRTISHTTAVHAYGSWNRARCNQASVATPTAPQDGVGRLSYLFGTMSPNSSKTVKVVLRRW
jgi:hypothetical protein